MEKILAVPVLDRSGLSALSAGDPVLLDGVIYTARDQAHKKIRAMMEEGKKLPFDPAGAAVYYCGPTPAREDGLFGSAGPTTSSRMDPFTVPLLKAGIAVTIGKGDRSPEILSACAQTGSLYLVTYGGAGAYLAKRIVRQEVVAFPELGAEAVYRLEVKGFPAVVAFDVRGKSIFHDAR